jgi:hypothetical protein
MQVRVLDKPQYAAAQDPNPQGYTETSVHVSKRTDHHVIPTHGPWQGNQTGVCRSINLIKDNVQQVDARGSTGDPEQCSATLLILRFVPTGLLAFS